MTDTPIEATLDYSGPPDRPLGRSRFVLQRTATVVDGFARFARLDADAPSDAEEPWLFPIVELSWQDFLDLGQPDQLTIATWPSDRQDLMELDDPDFPL